MAFCTKCGKELTEGSKFCSACGASIESRKQIDSIQTFTNPAETAKSKPIKKVNTRGCLISVAGFLFLVLVFIIAVSTAGAKINDSGATSETTVVEETTSKGEGLLVNTAGLTKDEAKSVLSDLSSVGVSELNALQISNGTGVDELQSFNFSGSGVSGTLTIEKRKTYYIGSGDFSLFDASKGGKLDSVTRYLLSDEEKIQFQIYAEDFVKQGLKAPSTADFPSVILTDAWKITRKDDVVTAQAYVDSQNSFGAMIRSNFVVQMSYTTGSCTYLAIDGTVMSGSLQK